MRVLKRLDNDNGFMGITHALSVLAVLLMVLAFAPAFFEGGVKTSSMWVAAAFILAAVGAGNLPDLDNTTSRARSDLGPLGVVLSEAFRGSSKVLQTVIRAKRDDADPDPHRGFWHTIPAAALVGFGVFMVGKTPGNISLPIIGETTTGGVITLLIFTVTTYLGFSTILKKLMDKIKNKSGLGSIIILALALIVSTYVFVHFPKDTNSWWLGLAIAVGMTIHILGDAMTASGAPIFFPITGIVKKKFWWSTRLLPFKIQAGGPIETYIFVPLFIVLIILAGAKLITAFPL